MSLYIFFKYGEVIRFYSAGGATLQANWCIKVSEFKQGECCVISNRKLTKHETKCMFLSSPVLNIKEKKD